MKAEDVTPGTVYPLLGKLLCFLPERHKKKLCGVTPQGQTVRSRAALRIIKLLVFANNFWDSPTFLCAPYSRRSTFLRVLSFH